MTRVRLHIADGEQQSMLDFRDLPIRIGRDESNECRLEFPFVSRSHARLELRGGRLVVLDCRSSAGTWVGEGEGVRLPPETPVDVQHIGGMLRIGSMVIRVEIPAVSGPRVETVAAPEPTLDASIALPAVARSLVSDSAGTQVLDVLNVQALPALSEPGRPIAASRRDELLQPAEFPKQTQAAERLLKTLAEIDPERIERETTALAGRSPLRFRALWEEYARRYAELVRRTREPPFEEGVETASRAGGTAPPPSRS